MARLFFIFCVFVYSACLVVEPTFDKLAPGPYRGIFYLDGRQSERRQPDSVAANFDLDDVPQAELPVEIDVSYAADSSLIITFINGAERIQASKVEFQRLITNARDSITIYFPLNDSYISGYHEDGTIEGVFVDESRKGDYRIPFAAFQGIAYRFTDLRKPPAIDLNGRWAAQFSVEDSTETYPAIAEFVQKGNELTGTFLTETGDYRYLSGTIQDQRAYLSVFDGGHVFLFAAKLQPDSSLLGIFRSGNHYQTIWTAKRDQNAKLAKADQLTKSRNQQEAVNPKFYDASSKQMSSLSNVVNSGTQLKVLTLMGSWCPNCRDEAVFLDSLSATFPTGQVQVIGLAYERFRDTMRAVAAVERFRQNLGIDYPIYVAGFADKAEATASLGFLDEVRSFPTLIVLDQNNRVVYTHTGFSGPATSEYGDFTRAFAKTLQDLLDR